MKYKILIRDINKPKNLSLKNQVRWICESLGLVSGRDTEDISFKIMFELLKLLSKNKSVSTEELARALKIEPARINHHIRCLMESGIIFREKRKIVFSKGNLTESIKDMKKQSEKIFDDVLEISERIDKKIK